MHAAFRTHLTFRRLRRAAAPRPEFRRALALRLEAERVLHARARRVWLPSPRMVAVPLTVVVVLAASGTSAYAYANDGVTEGHALYPVKRGIEEVEATLAPTALLKAHVRLRQAERRVREAERIFAHTADAAPTLAAADVASEAALDVAAHARPAVRVRILEQLRERDAAAAQRLRQAAERHPVAVEVMRMQIDRSIQRLEHRTRFGEEDMRQALERHIERRRALLLQLSP